MHLAAGGAIIRTMTDEEVKRRLTTVLCADVWRAMTGGSELVEFVLQCLLIGSRIPAFEREETMSFMWKVQGTATKSPPLTGTMKG